MSARSLPWLLVLLAGLLYVSPARADVELKVPADWAQPGFVDASATSRAREWAKTLGGTLQRTEASANADEYVETLAVIELRTPMDGEALQSDDAAQAYLDTLMAPLVGDATAQDLSREALASGVVSIRGHYIVGGTRLQTVLVPDGTKTALVIVGSLESEYVLYAPILSELLGSIEGGAAPVSPYDTNSFRTKYIIAWLIAFLAAFFGSIAVFSDRQGDYKRTGGFAAAIIGGLSILAAIATWLMLGDASASLEAVGSTAGDLAGEVFGVGVLGAVIIFGISQLLESDSGPVQSAPTASTIVSAPPAGHTPPASHAPPPSQAPVEAAGDEKPADAEKKEEVVHVIEDVPAEKTPEDAKSTAPMSAAKKSSLPPPPSSRVPPPPSSAVKRVKSSPLKAGKQANLEDAREEPAATIKRPKSGPVEKS